MEGVTMKKVEVTEKLAHYINIQRENEHHALVSDSIIAEAMVALHHAREALDEDKLHLVSSAECAVSELFYLQQQMRMTEESR